MENRNGGTTDINKAYDVDNLHYLEERETNESVSYNDSRSVRAGRTSVI